MSTMVDTEPRFGPERSADAGAPRQPAERGAALRMWFRLFVGISSAAVAIAVALGLVVVLTASAAQAQPAVTAGGADRVVTSRDMAVPRADPQDAPVRRRASAEGRTTAGDLQRRASTGSDPAGADVLPARRAPTAALQLMLGTLLLAAGFLCLLSRRGSGLLAGPGSH
jgi:hypothetical protein